jgi:hypothetical protein
MRVTKTEVTRYELAVERFAEGASLQFENLILRVTKKDAINCSVAASWELESITEQRARNDLDAASATLDGLLQSAPEIAAVVQDQDIEFELIHDYGNGAVLVAALKEGRLEWASGLPRGRTAG